MVPSLMERSAAASPEAPRAEPDSGQGALPTLLIIGAQKCGTTALHSYLSRHPQITMSSPKELDYFCAGGNLERGVDWYRSHFDPAAEVRGESSPNYTAELEFPGTHERIAATVPDARLIFMVRDPVDRVRSHWVHTYSNRVESRPLREAVLSDPIYVSRSLYHHQISLYLEHYPLDRVLVLEQGELSDERRETLKRVWRFLGVDEDEWRGAYKKRRLESSVRRRKTAVGALVANRVKMKTWRRLRDRRPFSVPFEQTRLDDSLRAELAEQIRDDANRFRELTGKDFEGWSA